MPKIKVSRSVKRTLDAVVADAKQREEREGDPNGMTDYTGTLEWAFDMASEASPDMRHLLH